MKWIKESYDKIDIMAYNFLTSIGITKHQDKVLHFAVGAIFTFVLAFLVPLIYAVLSGFLLGLIKEIVDRIRLGEGYFDLFDLMATSMGVFFGGFVFKVIIGLSSGALSLAGFLLLVGILVLILYFASGM